MVGRSAALCAAIALHIQDRSLHGNAINISTTSPSARAAAGNSLAKARGALAFQRQEQRLLGTASGSSAGPVLQRNLLPQVKLRGRSKFLTPGTGVLEPTAQCMRTGSQHGANLEKGMVQVQELSEGGDGAQAVAGPDACLLACVSA